MTDDILLTKAKAYLHQRVREALECAESDLSNMLRVTQAAGTDHASDCKTFAKALIYDVVKQRGRGVYMRSGSIDASECPSFDEVSANIARKAADWALEKLGSDSANETP